MYGMLTYRSPHRRRLPFTVRSEAIYRRLRVDEKAPKPRDPTGPNRHELSPEPIGSRLNYFKAIPVLSLDEAKRMASGLNTKIRQHRISCQFQDTATHSLWRLLRRELLTIDFHLGLNRRFAARRISARRFRQSQTLPPFPLNS